MVMKSKGKPGVFREREELVVVKPDNKRARPTKQQQLDKRTVAEEKANSDVANQPLRRSDRVQE